MAAKKKGDCYACERVYDEVKKCIDNSRDKTKTISSEIAQIVKTHLKKVDIGNNQIANQKIIKSKDGDKLIFRRKFFEETLAKCCRKKNIEETMQVAFEFEEWVGKLKLTRIEDGIHHDCKFRVYECLYKGKRLELKAKETEGLISYVMRIYQN